MVCCCLVGFFLFCLGRLLGGLAVQVSINYLRPTVEGDVLFAEATTVSDGKTLALCSVVVRKEDKDVAMFSGLAYKIRSDKKT